MQFLSAPFKGRGNILLTHKFEPPANARMLQGFEIFLRAVKAKFVVKARRRPNLFSGFQDSSLPVGGRYHSDDPRCLSHSQTRST